MGAERNLCHQSDRAGPGVRPCRTHGLVADGQLRQSVRARSRAASRRIPLDDRIVPRLSGGRGASTAHRDRGHRRDAGPGSRRRGGDACADRHCHGSASALQREQLAAGGREPIDRPGVSLGLDHRVERCSGDDARGFPWRGGASVPVRFAQRDARVRLASGGDAWARRRTT